MKIFSYSVFLFMFWFLLSGHTEPLLLILGLTSVLLTIILVKRMDVVDHESYPLHLYKQLPLFFIKILREIVYANIDVVKRIIKPGKRTISPQLIEIPVPQKTDLGRVIYANSITLTPGTVSIELTKDKIIVHALTKESAECLAGGSMAKLIPD